MKLSLEKLCREYSRQLISIIRNYILRSILVQLACDRLFQASVGLSIEFVDT